MKSRFGLIVALTLIAALVVPQFAFAQTRANATDMKISLTGSAGFPNAKGTAKYRDRNGEQDFQVEVENVRSLAGKRLFVFVDGKQVGKMRISQLGTGRLNLNSGNGDTVPTIHAGSSVEVRTRSGALVVSGSF